MIKLESSKMTRAIERAKAVRPRVRRIADRSYTVTPSNGQAFYTVRFVVAGGHKLAECDCKAGQSNQICYHVAAAAAVNIAFHSNYSKPSDERIKLISEIKAHWSREYSQASISAGLIRRFGVNRLEAVATDFLRQIRAAIA